MNHDLKVFLCRNTTIEPVWPTIRKKAEAEGWNLIGEMSGYGDFEAQVLNPASSMARFKPGLVWVWLELSPLHEAFWYDFAGLGPEGARQAEEDIAARMEAFLTQLAERYPVPVVVQNFVRPSFPALGLADGAVEWGQVAAVERINRRLADLCRRLPTLHYVDFDRFCSRLGLAARIDSKHWYLSNLSLAASYFQPYAAEWIRVLKAIYGHRRKCLVLDLDNTLWGGVVGEDGLQGIRLGGGYPGNAFRDFQRAILNLTHQGILLAVCSKNNEADALAVLDGHPEMILRREHFAALRINWADKARNLTEIAEELGLGLDSFVFLDDRPEEREWVRSQLPEVLVPDFPAEPYLLPQFLQSLDAFETFRLSEEDRQRTELYHQRTERTATRVRAASLEDYLRSLGLKMQIQGLDAATTGRMAQLTQKTNQFNLLTRRLTEAELTEFRSRGGWVYGGRVSDRFGDSGIVIVAMISLDGPTARIENFLMSCRVIGLTVEQAFFAWLADGLAKRGVRRVVGEFHPTEKNALAADFYERMGFARVEGLPDGASLWELELPGGPLLPDWFEVRAMEEDGEERESGRA